MTGAMIQEKEYKKSHTFGRTEPYEQWYTPVSGGFITVSFSAFSSLEIRAVYVGEVLPVSSHVQSCGESLEERFRRLAEITTSPNWDSDHGLLIPQEEWLKAWRLCRGIAKKYLRLPEPFPSPSGDGFVHLTWSNRKDKRFVIELKGDIVLWSFEKMDGTWEYGESPNTNDAVRQLCRYFE